MRALGERLRTGEHDPHAIHVDEIDGVSVTWAELSILPILEARIVSLPEAGP